MPSRPLALLALPLLVSCQGDTDKGTTPVAQDDTAQADTAAPAYEVQELQAAALDTVTTVIDVSWRTPEALRSWVEFGETAALGHQTDASQLPRQDHDFLLLGMPPETEVYYQLVHEDTDGNELRSAVFTASTGALPAAFPQLTLSEGSTDLGVYVVSTLAGGAWGPVIYDGMGRPVWYYLDTGGFNTYRARLSRDGRAVYYNAVGTGDVDSANKSAIARVSLAGEVEGNWLVSGLTHDFVELPDGDIVTIAYDVREVEGEQVRGDKLVRLDPKTGNTTDLWTTWDHWDPATSGHDDGDDTWTHANAIDYDAEENCFYLGIRDFGSIIKLDADTFEREWGLSGDANSFDWVGEGDGWVLEHQFEVTGDKILVFDNGDKTRASSWIQEYTLDTEAMTAERTWLYEADPTIFVYALGDVDTLPSGDLLVTWATSGLFQRITREGEVTWQLSSPLGFAAGYTVIVEELYPR